MLLLKLVFLLAVLVAVLWGLARFLHGFHYTEVPRSLNWRAPVAALILWLLGLALPSLAAGEGPRAWPVTFNELFLFTGAEDDALEFGELVVLPDKDATEGTVYTRRHTSRGLKQGVEYQDDTGQALPGSTQFLLGRVLDDQRQVKETVRFEVIRDKDGYIDKPVRYKDDQGRVMTESDLGRVVLAHNSQVGFHLLAIAVSWLVWFLAFWLLLQFLVPQALIYAFLGWLIWALVLNFTL